LVLSVAVFGLLLSPVVLADCDKHAEATGAKEAASCCSKKAQQAKAEMKDCCKEAGGRENCEKCEQAAVAASAKSGCSKIREAVAEGHHTAETAMLAAHAANGCSKSTAQLVAMVKESGCPKGAALVAKVEAGDDDAKAELIAMFAEDETEE